MPIRPREPRAASAEGAAPEARVIYGGLGMDGGMNPVVEGMRRKLEGMERDGAVDMSILEDISKVRRAAERIKSKWIGVEDADGFYFYHGADNICFALSQMERRFKASQEAGDNPRVASDSLELLPPMDRMLTITRTSRISPASVGRVLDATDGLRDCAAGAGMVESFEDAQKSVDMDFLRSHLGAIVQRLNEIR